MSIYEGGGNYWGLVVQSGPWNEKPIDRGRKFARFTPHIGNSLGVGGQAHGGHGNWKVNMFPPVKPERIVTSSIVRQPLSGGVRTKPGRKRPKKLPTHPYLFPKTETVNAGTQTDFPDGGLKGGVAPIKLSGNPPGAGQGPSSSVVYAGDFPEDSRVDVSPYDMVISELSSRPSPGSAEAPVNILQDASLPDQKVPSYGGSFTSEPEGGLSIGEISSIVAPESVDGIGINAGDVSTALAEELSGLLTRDPSTVPSVETVPGEDTSIASLMSLPGVAGEAASIIAEDEPGSLGSHLDFAIRSIDHSNPDTVEFLHQQQNDIIDVMNTAAETMTDTNVQDWGISIASFIARRGFWDVSEQAQESLSRLLFGTENGNAFNHLLNLGRQAFQSSIDALTPSITNTALGPVPDTVTSSIADRILQNFPDHPYNLALVPDLSQEVRLTGNENLHRMQSLLAWVIQGLFSAAVYAGKFKGRLPSGGGKGFPRFPPPGTGGGGGGSMQNIRIM